MTLFQLSTFVVSQKKQTVTVIIFNIVIIRTKEKIRRVSGPRSEAAVTELHRCWSEFLSVSAFQKTTFLKQNKSVCL